MVARKKTQESPPIFSGSWKPNRFEYFTASILQGLVTGRSERDLRNSVKTALNLATEVEKELDS
jgi:hypothetical protein